ncbi:MAG: 3',5'-cyclic-nucleotide phosphodiesterase [Burkholderiaceae bacterium]
MKLQVLGCSGGIGGREQLTTCMLLDHDILIDAGTGLSSLGMAELIKIDHVFISHSHLDHVTGLALLLDAVLGKRSGPITVHASEKVIASLKQHMFNWLLWPDFAQIPTADDPILRWEPMQAGVTLDLGGRLITAHPVNHTVDAVGYWVHNNRKGFLFTGDLSTTPELWSKFMHEDKLEKVIVDCSFPNAELELANLSKHYCPQTLIDDIRPMAKSIEFLIYHLKPGQEEQIMEELSSEASDRILKALTRSDVFVF